MAAINGAGMYAILDLQWAAPGSAQATQQWPMADADHAVTFWSQIASTFGADPAAMFELFNEPYIGGYSNVTAASWACWLNGCSNSDGPATYTTAGVQQMVNAIRATGAQNVILLGGLGWSGDPCSSVEGVTTAAACEMMSYLPTDPAHQIALELHSYGDGAAGSSGCSNTTCLGVIRQAATANGLPIVADEIGDTNGTANYITTFMNWADANNVGYLGWSWTPGSGVYDLVLDDSGTCNPPEGCVFQSHFASVNP